MLLKPNFSGSFMLCYFVERRRGRAINWHIFTDGLTNDDKPSTKNRRYLWEIRKTYYKRVIKKKTNSPMGFQNVRFYSVHRFYIIRSSMNTPLR